MTCETHRLKGKGQWFTSNLQNKVHWTVERAKYSLSAPPGEGDVRGSKCVVSCPSILLQLQGWSRINVRDKGSKNGKQQDDRSVMTGPHIQAIGNGQSTEQEEPDLENDFSFGNSTRWNGSVGFIDGINFTVVPIIDCLSISRQKGSGQNHGDKTLGSIFQAQQDIAIIGIKGIPHPMVVSRSRGPTHDTPNQGNPGDGFGQLQSNLPNITFLRSALDTQQLTKLTRLVLVIRRRCHGQSEQFIIVVALLRDAGKRIKGGTARFGQARSAVASHHRQIGCRSAGGRRGLEPMYDHTAGAGHREKQEIRKGW